MFSLVMLLNSAIKCFSSDHNLSHDLEREKNKPSLLTRLTVLQVNPDDCINNLD